MSQGTRSPPIWRFEEQLARLTADMPFAELANFDAGISVELYRPFEIDQQGPHSRDELYIVSAGSGRFRLAAQSFSFAAGDMIFVPAHEEHRFEDFSEDFSTWVIFFGPEKPRP